MERRLDPYERAEEALENIIERAHWLTLAAARRQEYVELGGLDFNSYRDMQGKIGKAIKELREVARELKSLNGHCHKWNDNDYCSICGADGRA